MKNIIILLIAFLSIDLMAGGFPIKEHSDSLTYGTGNNTDEKQFVWDIGDGILNPKMTIDTANKEFNFSTNLNVGNGTDVDIYLKASNGDANPPNHRYNSSSNQWEFSNDGIVYNAVGAGGGGLVSPLTTKGDIWTYCASDDRKGVGANGFYIEADSSDPCGWVWKAFPGVITDINFPQDVIGADEISNMDLSVGSLFWVNGSVGSVYATVWQDHRINIETVDGSNYARFYQAVTVAASTNYTFTYDVNQTGNSFLAVTTDATIPTAGGPTVLGEELNIGSTGSQSFNFNSGANTTVYVQILPSSTVAGFFRLSSVSLQLQGGGPELMSEEDFGTGTDLITMDGWLQNGGEAIFLNPGMRIQNQLAGQTNIYQPIALTLGETYNVEFFISEFDGDSVSVPPQGAYTGTGSAVINGSLSMLVDGTTGSNSDGTGLYTDSFVATGNDLVFQIVFDVSGSGRTSQNMDISYFKFNRVVTSALGTMLVEDSGQKATGKDGVERTVWRGTFDLHGFANAATIPSNPIRSIVGIGGDYKIATGTKGKDDSNRVEIDASGNLKAVKAATTVVGGEMIVLFTEI